MAFRSLSGASKTERLAARYIPKDARCILEHDNGSALYVYEVAGKLYAIAFWGTSGKSLFHYSYRTEDQRTAKIQEFKLSVEHSVTFRADQRAKRTATPNGLKTGDILCTSWGYDQTNVDFYVVTRTSGKRTWVRRIAGDYEATGHMSGRTWPCIPIRMTGDETLHIAQGTSLVIDGHHALLAEGRDHYTSSYA